MPDPIDDLVVANGPTPGSSPAPVTEAPAPAHADQAPIAPAAEVASLPSSAGASPDAATEKPAAAAEVPESEPTLLEKFDAEQKAKAETDKPAADPTKPEGEKPAAEAKPGEPAAPVEAAPLPPIEYKYELPETLQLNDAQRTDVHSAFDAFRADPSGGAQKLVDLHAKLVGDAVESVRKDQYRVFNDTRRQWRDQVMADPELGGSRYQTAMSAVARRI